MAIAARYCIKTTGAVFPSSMGCFMQTDQIKHPKGETQTLEPRPRPATCVVAVKVKPAGSLESSFEFLGII